MSMHSKWIRDNLVFYDKQRWLDAIGANVVKVKEEFQYGNWAVAAGDATGLNREGWLMTFVEVGAGGQLASLVGGADGGELLITTAGNEDAQGMIGQLAFLEQPPHARRRAFRQLNRGGLDRWRAFFGRPRFFDNLVSKCHRLPLPPKYQSDRSDKFTA